MMSMAFWGFVVRFIQSLAQASPFILTGLFVAVVIRRFIGYERTRLFFGGSELKALFKAWVIGMLLPVCSLGVIPVALELRRAGIRGGTILAFAMAAPLFNPLSLLYGLTLSEPIAILSFAMGSLVIVTVVGLIWDTLFPGTELSGLPDETVSFGIRRITALGASCGVAATGRPMFLMLIGLCGVGLLGALIPHTALQPMFNHDRPWAPVVMTGLAIPVYATPMLAMSQMGMMFQHANSIGAAFALLTLGAGMNLGLIQWMLQDYGLKRAAAWMLILVAVVIGLGYAIEAPLFPTDIDPANHTHAFDVYAQPFASPQPFTELAGQAGSKLKQDIKPYEWYSLELLLIAVLAGIVIRIADRKGAVGRWIHDRPQQNGVTGKFDVVVPPGVLGGLALVALVIFSIAGCFAYYPEPKVVFDEMNLARTEALSAALAGDSTHAEYWIAVYQEWTRKLEVGVALRSFQLTDYQHWKARLLREQLELLKHLVEDQELEEARKWVSKLHRTHQRLRAAFKVDVPSQSP